MVSVHHHVWFLARANECIVSKCRSIFLFVLNSRLETRAALCCCLCIATCGFWQDTIRKILYETTRDDQIAERLFETVTEHLKTYSTRETNLAKDFDLIVELASFLPKRRESDPDQIPLSRETSDELASTDSKDS